MSNQIELELKKEIFPIYKDLLSKNDFKDICTFAIQWGKEFPKEDNKGVLFVGKAVNGWITNDQNAENLFAIDNSERIFNRKDQIEWVNDLSGNTKGYNTKKSAFWRVIKNISYDLYADNWYKKIAWSNIYKIAPWNGGNPGSKMQRQQRLYCLEILKSEINILKPEYVIMLTSGWEWFFIQELKKQNELKEVSKVKWSGYETTMFLKDNVKYIISHHPQGKKEQEHSKAIIELMNIEI